MSALVLLDHFLSVTDELSLSLIFCEFTQGMSHAADHNL
jgi:hypothetical protein